MSRLGLALGSGGARGWCHIGVLRALDQLGLKPEVVAGCSMGALVGAAWAAGKLDALEDWARSMTQTRMLKYVDLRFENGGLLRGGTVRDLMAEVGLPERIEDLDHPFLAVATDIATGHEVWIREGDLFDAVRASISIPAVFCPHLVNGKWLLDGGLINPVPSSACRALGADRIVSVNPNGKFGHLWEPGRPMLEQIGATEWLDKLPSVVGEQMREMMKSDTPKGPDIFEVMSTSIDIMTEFVRKARSASDPAHLELEADLNHMSVLELYRAQEAIDEGARIVEAQADALRQLATDTPS